MVILSFFLFLLLLTSDSIMVDSRMSPFHARDASIPISISGFYENLSNLKLINGPLCVCLTSNI